MIGCLVVRQQQADIGAGRLEIIRQCAGESRLDLRIDVGHRRRLLDEPEPAVLLQRGELAHGLLGGALLCVGDGAGEDLLRLRVAGLQATRGVEVVVVPRERRLVLPVGERADVLQDGGARGVGGDGVVAAGALPGDHDARDEPLEVPLPGRPGGLVEVVEIEHEGALRRRVEAEVRHVRIAARGDLDAARRPGPEIGRHERGGAEVERERARRHPCAAQRDELGDTRGILRAEDAERVPLAGGKLGEDLAGPLLAQRPPFVVRRGARGRGDPARGWHVRMIALGGGDGVHDDGSRRSTFSEPATGRSSTRRSVRASSSSAPATVPKRSRSPPTAVRVTNASPVSHV